MLAPPSQQHQPQGSLATSVANLVLPTLINVYEKVTGKQYSKDEQQRLRLLRDCYEQTFQQDTPAFWQLDDQNRPTHTLQKTTWLQEIHHQQQRRGHTHTLHYFIELGLDCIGSYLDERRERTWPFSGNKGDVTEQFFAEMMHFLLNDLPSFRVDQEAIDTLEKRIQYLDLILNTEHLFYYGKLPFHKNKMAVIRHLRDILNNCREYAIQESHRAVARDKLEILRNETESLLLNGLHWIYYCRQTPVHHEPFQLSAYSGEIQESKQEELYARLWQTHTGAILKEILLLSEPGCFGAHHHVIKPAQYNFEYFTEAGNIKPYDLKRHSPDLPIWLNVQVQEEIDKTQQLGFYLLRLSKLKKIIDEAYELTGQVGDLWAYGDRLGKASLASMLKLLHPAQKQLFDLLNDLATTRKQRCDFYNAQHHVEPHENPNPNFHRAWHKYQKMRHLQKRILQKIYEIEEQMRAFPENAEARINEKKQNLYRALNAFIQEKLPPEERDKLQFCANYSELSANTVNQDEKALPPTCEHFIPLKTDIRRNAFGCYFVFQDAPTKAIKKAWQIGDDYDEWEAGFLEREQASFLELIGREDILQNCADAAVDKNELQALIPLRLRASKQIERIRLLHQKLISQLIAEQPAWRFQWRSWPIQTAGWPFNQNALGFSQKLQARLHHQLDLCLKKHQAIEKMISEKIEDIQEQKEVPAPENQETALKIYHFCEQCIKAINHKNKRFSFRSSRKLLHAIVDFDAPDKLKKVYQNIAEMLSQYLQQEGCTPKKTERLHAELLIALFTFLQRPTLNLKDKEHLFALIETFFDRLSARSFSKQSLWNVASSTVVQASTHNRRKQACF
jgi:hypothetical protein